MIDPQSTLARCYAIIRDRHPRCPSSVAHFWAKMLATTPTIPGGDPVAYAGEICDVHRSLFASRERFHPSAQRINTMRREDSRYCRHHDC